MLEFSSQWNPTTNEAREALPKLERPPLRVVHMGAGRGSSWPRWWTFNGKKPTAVKNKILNSSTTEQLETKDIQICVLFSCGFHGWILGALNPKGLGQISMVTAKCAMIQLNFGVFFFALKIYLFFSWKNICKKRGFSWDDHDAKVLEKLASTKQRLRPTAIQ